MTLGHVVIKQAIKAITESARDISKNATAANLEWGRVIADKDERGRILMELRHDPQDALAAVGALDEAAPACNHYWQMNDGPEAEPNKCSVCGMLASHQYAAGHRHTWRHRGAEPPVTRITATCLMEVGRWDKFCELRGWNPWIVNEGQLDCNMDLNLTTDEALAFGGVEVTARALITAFLASAALWVIIIQAVRMALHG